MKRQAFLLGLFSISGQVLLLRELIRTFHGNELFIGTALFGWLIAVALGAFIGGNVQRPVSPVILFVLGVILLPFIIIVIRMYPHLSGTIIGETISFSTAVIISCLAMLPIGFLSGWLFPIITKQGRLLSKSVARVYLQEGIGAFAGGVVILLLTGGLLSTLQTTGLMGLGIIAGLLTTAHTRPLKQGIIAVFCLVLFAGIYPLLANVDRSIDRINYQQYTIVSSFDTHYSHQTILTRDSSIVLLTDNTVEAVYPNIESAEYILLPPLAYIPDTGRVLILGGARMAIEILADSLPTLSFTIVDPRNKLDHVLDTYIARNKNVSQYTDDPITFLTEEHAPNQFDIIIINPGELDSYQNNRFLTDRILSRCRQLLQPHGLLYFPTKYDTDRYITNETASLLGAINTVLHNTFAYVTAWPGTNTLFFASQTPLFNIPYDSLVSNLTALSYQPQYVNDYYLRDRLSSFRLERLNNTLQAQHETTSFVKPRLLYLQTLYRAKAHRQDTRIISKIFFASYWLPLVLICIIIGVLFFTCRNRSQAITFSLFFTAGLVSLSMELIVFYIFQSSAGTLYSEIAVLIGAFMLGLATGTSWALHYGGTQLAPVSLFFLLMATAVFTLTYTHIPITAALLYFALFLFAVALATGGLFVGTTNRVYKLYPLYNPGSGYAFEILGSAIGALFSITILLPMIGLYWLFVAIIGVIVIALVGAIAIER